MSEAVIPRSQLTLEKGHVVILFDGLFHWKITIPRKKGGSRKKGGRDPLVFQLEGVIGAIPEEADGLIPIHVERPDGLSAQLRRFVRHDEKRDFLLQLLQATIPANLAEWIVDGENLPPGSDPSLSEFLWETHRVGPGRESCFNVCLG